MTGHRHAIRLRGYDYSRGGAYFLTVCVQRAEVILNEEPAFSIIEHVWDGLRTRFAGIELDAFVVMPNHIHGIIVLPPRFMAKPQPIRGSVGAVLAPPFIRSVTSGKGTASGAPTNVAEKQKGAASSAPTAPRPSLPAIVRAFKSISAIRINQALGRRGRLWQRNYYERIIRNDDELFRIREYIANNPRLWNIDRENPDRTGQNDIYDWLYS